MSDKEVLPGAVTGGVRMVLKLEGAALFALATGAYFWTAQSWWLFAILFLAPDLSFLAYLVNARIGAATYNATHSTVGPFALAATGALAGSQMAVALALIWAAHVGFDRALGYGLKYITGFGDTHLGRIGKRPGTGT